MNYDEVPKNGREAFETGRFTRRDDPFWIRGSTKSSPQSRQWCREWDEAYREVHGDTHIYPFKSKQEMN